MKSTRIAFFLSASILFIFVFMSSCSEEQQNVEAERVFNKIRGVASYRKEFNDLNPIHLSSAKKIGISPIASRDDVEVDSKELLYIGSNPYYNVDKLTHSIPYLVPRASAVLMAIAMNFQDSLESKGLDKHKIIVTSVLRTKNDVKKLRKGNTNASLNSAHFYGTTFDISYNRFSKPLEGEEDEEIREVKLKLVLSEVLRDMRDAGLCYVKHEVKQGCFHVTAR